MLRGGLERTQTLRPEDFERGPELRDGLRSCAVQALRAVPPFGDEAGVFQDAQMLRNRGPRYIEAARDLPDRELPARDETKDLAATGLAEGGKCVDFLRVSGRLLTVKAQRRPSVTDSRLNHD
jgi:hypothetical protein